ncbi:MAG TPA: helix-turn-helix transcriptional regulator [Dehalococcoidia bacterium]|nr:helix-turn-helix transcriptional regulator [Dehalococcoidia bacterium]
MARWTSQGYRRIVRADEHDGMLTVGFADGTCATLPLASLLPAGAPYQAASQPTHTNYEVILKAVAGEIAIPWDEIRILTDAEFSQQMARDAERRARRIGVRIRELRRERGLTIRELAQRASISPVSLSRIENGRHDVVLTTLARILAAMGRSLRDLVTPGGLDEAEDDTCDAPDVKPGVTVLANRASDRQQ